MSGLQDFRKKYPQYDDIPDGVLADKLYQKHYSDIPREEFNKRLGLSQAAPASAPDPAETADTPLARTLMEARRSDPTGAMAAPPGIPQEHIPDLMTADLGPRKGPGMGQKFIDATADVTRSTIDLMRSAGQRTSPVVRDYKGDFIRPYLGVFRERATDAGFEPLINTPDGNIPLDPEKHVVLYDPVTRKDQVFERTEKTEAGLAENLGHMLGVGMVTNAATRLPGGIAGMGTNPKTQLLEDFNRMGVRPSQPVISQGKATGTAAQALAKMPIAGEGIIRNVQKTFQDTVQAVNRVAEKFGTARSADDIGRSIQEGVRRAGQAGQGTAKISAPSRLTSFRTKADLLYNRARDLVGKGAEVSMARTKQAIDSVLNKYGNAGLNELLKNPQLEKFAKVLEEGGTLPFADAQAFRSELGALTRSAGDDVMRNVKQADVNRIYSAMTQDLMGAAQKAGGTAAARALRRADQFYAAGNKRIDNALKRFVGKGVSPEQAYQRLQDALSQKSTANIQAALALKRTLRPEEWNDIAATVIQRMGQPTAGAASNVADEAFSIGRFVTGFNKLSDKGKQALFGGPLRKEMEALVRVVSAQKDFEKLANTSNTAPNLMWMILPGAAVADFGTTVAATGIGRATAELLMSPKFVKWLHQAGTARLPQEQAVMMGQLQKLVQQEPHLSIPLQRLFAGGSTDTNFPEAETPNYQ